MFDWDRILFNEAPGTFLVEVALRSVIMFITLLITLKIAGKRGVKQLSVFEMVIIISLGSAAGDPMFYEDVGIVHALVVFVVVLVLYRFITWLTGKSSLIEKFLEGKTECLVDEGKFSMQKFELESLAQDDTDEDVKMGLPILPELFNKQLSFISQPSTYCCCKCGEVSNMLPGRNSCSVCHGTKWVLPIQTTRVTQNLDTLFVLYLIE